MVQSNLKTATLPAFSFCFSFLEQKKCLKKKKKKSSFWDSDNTTSIGSGYQERHLLKTGEWIMLIIMFYIQDIAERTNTAFRSQHICMW